MHDSVDRLIDRTARRLALQRSVASAGRWAGYLLLLGVAVAAGWQWLPSPWAIGAIVLGGLLSAGALRSDRLEDHAGPRARGASVLAMCAIALAAGVSTGGGLLPGWLAGWAVMLTGGLVGGTWRWARGVTPRQAGRALGEALVDERTGRVDLADVDGRFATWADVRGTDAARSQAGAMLHRQCLDVVGDPRLARGAAFAAGRGKWDRLAGLALLFGLVWAVWVVSAPTSEPGEVARLAQQARRASAGDRAELAEALRQAARARGSEKAEALRRAAVLVVEGRDAEATARLLREAGLEPREELSAELLARLAGPGAVEAEQASGAGFDEGVDSGSNSPEPGPAGGAVRVYTPPLADASDAGDTGEAASPDGGWAERYVPLGGAWQRARREASDALRRGSVPPRLRELVRGYFQTGGLHASPSAER